MKEIKEKIVIRNARVNNLKIDYLEIPKNKLIVITGVSGSGKSSLAFDTIYAEAERRFVESLSSYARQFLGIKEKPDVDSIEGLSPAIAIDQRSYIRNPRSTVGTTVGIYDYLRILFAQFGQAFCPLCQIKVEQKNSAKISKEINALFLKSKEILIFSPIFEGKKGEHKNVISEILNSGFPKVSFDNHLWRTDELLNSPIDKNKRHSIQVLIDELVKGDFEPNRLSDSVKTALKIGKGYLKVFLGSQDKFNKNSSNSTNKTILFSEHFSCPQCGFSFPKIEPRLFSFNSPYGACAECSGLGVLIKVDPDLVFPNKNLTLAEGAIKPWATASHRVGRQSWYWYQIQDLAERHNFSLNKPLKELPPKIIDLILYGDNEFEGVVNNLQRRWKESPSQATKEEIEKYMTKVECPVCHGRRLKPEALAIKVNGLNISQISDFDIGETEKFFAQYQTKLTGNLKHAAELLIKEIEKRLGFLKEVGLNYLTLARESTTLSGGEAQRVRLATQISSGLSGIIYVLDEPSSGLHPRDQARLLKALKFMRDLQNTVIVVEHDRQTMQAADWLIEIGPGAGDNGGKIVFQGFYQQMLRSKTLTGQYLAGQKKVFEAAKPGQVKNNNILKIIGASEHNLKNITANFPLAKLIGVAGVSGSGKSSLIVDTLGRALMKHFYNAKEKPGAYKEIKGLGNIDKAVIVDQSPIGRTPRSNPATYTGAFNYIREIFSKTEIARMRGYSPGHFSFNVKGGRCPVCEGDGYKKVEMYFLPDVYVECEECNGTRYSQEVLEIEYNSKNISQVLQMSVYEAAKFFKDIPVLSQKFSLLQEVGLGYVKLGQSAITLSGGEAQRIKLSKELSRRATGKTLYILDEPTFGLHFDDIRKLTLVLKRLVNFGNTVIVIEHNPEFLSACDWLIDLGPEGGGKGGKVIFQGSAKEIKKSKFSYTAKFLTF